MLISPHYRDADWNRLNLSNPSTNEDDWQTAAHIVEDRFRGRLIKWIDKIASEQFSGFAVLALDCVLIEALWGFETGKQSPGSTELYEKFLTRPIFKSNGFDQKAAGSFCSCIRTGIAHDGETRKGWLIEMTVPKGKIIETTSSGEYRLNRTEFHTAVVSQFEEWLQRVREPRSGERKRMRDRMEQIIHKSAPAAT